MEDEKLPLHCSLDELLDGGIEAGIITEIYGEGATGKTNICLQAAKSCVATGKKVVYVDTEGISKERVMQVIGDKKQVGRILFFFPFSLKEQEEMIEKISKIDCGMIIVDSINLFYRLEMEDENSATRSLTKQLVNLQITSRKRRIPVIITSQVYSSGNDIKPFAGRSIDHMAKTIIRLEKLNEKHDGREARLATIVKHRSLPEGRSVKFFISSHGIE